MLIFLYITGLLLSAMSASESFLNVTRVADED